jgi:hypothetical protein
LFTLFLVELGKRLEERRIGVTIGDALIPGLFFADDIVLMADREKDLVQLMAELVNFTEEKGLGVNWSKTKGVIIGKGSRARTEGDQIEVAETGHSINIAKEYPYLGTKITSAKGGGQKKLVEGLNRKVGAAKHLAGSTKDQSWAARALWAQSVKPAILHGLETQTITATTIKKINQAQNSMARWALGVSRRAPEAGLRILLGLPSIQGVLMKRKLIWLCRIEHMESSRWPKMVLEAMRIGTYTSPWLNELQEALQVLGITEEEVREPGKGKDAIKKA